MKTLTATIAKTQGKIRIGHYVNAMAELPNLMKKRKKITSGTGLTKGLKNAWENEHLERLVDNLINYREANLKKLNYHWVLQISWEIDRLQNLIKSDCKTRYTTTKMSKF